MRTLAPATVGIVGSGQLGWMMITEGRKLQHRFYVLDDNVGPATRVADGHLPLGEYKKFVEMCDVVTFEFEHVSERVLEYANKKGKLFPSLASANLKTDRSREKMFLRDHGFPVAEFGVAKNRRDALHLARRLGSAVIKSSRGGYDGKAQYYYGGDRTIPRNLDFAHGCVVEAYVKFDCEASIVASRDRDGKKLFHRPTFNKNEQGILFYTEAPVPDFGMREIASRLLDALDYVGVMVVEFFIVHGRAIINEFAPRVHNSGHHTLHGSSISQFEQHLRVISGLPVPEPVLFRPSGIVNAVGVDIGKEMQGKLLPIPETRTYSYGKLGLRRRRKMGHVNITAKNRRELKERIRHVTNLLYDGHHEAYFAA